MRSLRGFAASSVFSLLACFWTAQVFADAIVTSAARAVTAIVDVILNDEVSQTTSGSFAQSTSTNLGGQEASSTQDSSIGVLQFGGTGHSEVSGSTSGVFGATSLSFYLLDFDLNVNHAYSLSGSLEEFLDGGGSITLLQLTGPGTEIELFAIENAGPLNFATSGVFGPGSYALYVQAFSFGLEGTNYFVRTDFDFNLTLQEVSEPATLALLGIGLVGLGFSRRKQVN